MTCPNDMGVQEEARSNCLQYKELCERQKCPLLQGEVSGPSNDPWEAQLIVLHLSESALPLGCPLQRCTSQDNGTLSRPGSVALPLAASAPTSPQLWGGPENPLRLGYGLHRAPLWMVHPTASSKGLFLPTIKGPRDRHPDSTPPAPFDTPHIHTETSRCLYSTHIPWEISGPIL